MSKTDVENFDPSVCRGTHPDVDGPCPRYEAGDKGEPEGAVDRLSRIETAAVEAVTGEDPGRCGICTCPLPNLAAFNVAPEKCPRLHLHDG